MALRAVVVLTALLSASGPAPATVVLKVGMDEMVRRSELVFEGRALRVEARRPSPGGQVRTYVTFDILDVIKGDYAEQTVELSFLGGTVAGTTFQVTDMSVPEPGETGIYFVESLTRRQIHPFYGWSQGHFLVLTDTKGVRRVFAKDGQAVAAVEAPATVLTRREISTGTARGLVLAEQAAVSAAMPVEDFKAALRAMANGS